MFEKRNEKQPGNSLDATTEVKSPRPAVQAVVKTATIGPGININGDISGTENLVIEGKVDGVIQLPGHSVEVGASGRVNANISARFIKVDGELHGDIDGSEKVVISKAGNVKGNIRAPRVQLDDGAIFKGSIEIDPTEKQSVELPLGVPKKADNVQKLETESSAKETGFTAKG